MFTDDVYRPKQFQLSELEGISNRTLEMHFKLYEGYVEQTNLLNEKHDGRPARNPYMVL